MALKLKHVNGIFTSSGMPDTIGQYLHNSYKRFFLQSMSAWQGGFLLGILSILMFAYLQPWFVFPALWGSWIYASFGIGKASALANPLLNGVSVLDLGIMGGVLASALFAHEFKIRRDTSRGYLQGLLGGALMGVGVAIAPACNVGAFFTAISALSLSGFGVMLGLLMGGYIGGRLLIWQAKRKASHMLLEATDWKQTSSGSRSLSQSSPRVGVIVLAILAVSVGAYMYASQPVFGGILLFGVAFGVVVQRSRLCFASAFREIFTTRNNRLMRALIVGITVGVIGFAILKAGGLRPVAGGVQPFGIHNVVGGLVFGIGMVIAGGCGFGMLWRSAEGYVRLWFAMLGGMLSSAAWPFVYGAGIGQGWLYGTRVFLPDVLGWAGAIAVTLGAIWGWYLFVTWSEIRSRRVTYVHA